MGFLLGERQLIMHVLPEMSDRRFDIRVNACQLQLRYEGD